MITPLTKAFKELRKAGYLAERKYACCRSCGGANIPDEFASLFVFTTDQDEADLKRDGWCYLSWSAPEDSSAEIIRIFKRCGVRATHNRDPKTRIKIWQSKL